MNDIQATDLALQFSTRLGRYLEKRFKELDQLLNTAKQQQRANLRKDELIADYERDKLIIGQELGLVGDDAMVHRFQLDKIRDMKTEIGVARFMDSKNP